MALLPKIGSSRMEIPSEIGKEKEDKRPLPCTVVYVHRRHLWYMVQFESGMKESYKVPASKSWGTLQYPKKERDVKRGSSK